MANYRITVSEIINACRDLYKRGRLTAQHPTDPDCVYYTADNYCCAIGAVFSPEMRDGISAAAGSVKSLISDYNVEFDDAQRAIKLQTLHDEWCGARRTLLSLDKHPQDEPVSEEDWQYQQKHAAERELEFRRAIGL